MHRTDATLVLGRSGSMQQVRSEDHSTLPGECLLCVLQWNSSAIEWVFQAQPIAQVQSISSSPAAAPPCSTPWPRRSTTPATAWPPCPSPSAPAGCSPWSSPTAAYQWEFLFFGASVDAIAEATADADGMPIGAAGAYVANKQGVESLGKKVRYAAQSFRASGDVREGLVKAEKEDAEGAKGRASGTVN